jgi:integrase
LGILNIKNDPFRKLVLPQYLSNASAKALSVDDIRKIINFEIPKKIGYRLSTMNDGKDYFLLSFYLLGINPVDMYYLTKEQYNDGRITYSRRKTQRRVGGSEISIPVCDKARELIEKHKGRGEWLLDMQQNYNKVEGVVSMVSKVLDNIYNLMELGIDEDKFTWYSARHTWASIAANECHFSDAEVARALNHQSEHRVTRGYIRPDWSLLDRMNEAVLAVVFQSSVTD